MGLVRNLKPVSNSVTGTNNWTVIVNGSISSNEAYSVLDDNIGTYRTRAGVETDLANDTDFVRVNIGPGDFRTTLRFAPHVGSDTITRVVFGLRADLSAAGSQPVTIFHRHGAVDYDIATIDVNSTTTFNYELNSYTDPATGLSWDGNQELFDGAEFGFRISFIQGVRVRRFYIRTETTVGPTLSPKGMTRRNWRFCDICNRKSPYDQLRRPDAPHPKAGLVVCVRCYDDLDHETLRLMNGSHPPEMEDTLY